MLLGSCIVSRMLGKLVWFTPGSCVEVSVFTQPRMLEYFFVGDKVARQLSRLHKQKIFFANNVSKKELLSRELWIFQTPHRPKITSLGNIFFLFSAIQFAAWPDFLRPRQELMCFQRLVSCIKRWQMTGFTRTAKFVERKSLPRERQKQQTVLLLLTSEYPEESLLFSVFLLG